MAETELNPKMSAIVADAVDYFRYPMQAIVPSEATKKM